MTTPSLLRPDPQALADEWRALVEAEFAQVERLREFMHHLQFAAVRVLASPI